MGGLGWAGTYLVDAAEEYMGWIGAGADGAVEEDQLTDVQRGVVGWDGGDAGDGVGAGNEGCWIGVLGGLVWYGWVGGGVMWEAWRGDVLSGYHRRYGGNTR